MTTKTRREFTNDFKGDAVGQLEGGGRVFTQVAAELGIQPSMLRNWRPKGHSGLARSRAGPSATAPGGPAGASPADLALQNAKLKRELDRTRIGRDVPKIRIFA